MSDKARQRVHLILGIIATLVVLRTILVWDGQPPIYFFFTTQTNLLVALYWLWAGLGFESKLPKTTAWLAGAVTTYITITMAVYLAPLHKTFYYMMKNQLVVGNMTQWQYFVECFMNYMLHIFIPILIIADYIFLTPGGKKVRPYQWLIYPILYGAFHTIYGMQSWRYIYPFINPFLSGGWGAVARNGVIVFVLFALIGYGLYALNQVVNRRRQRKAEEKKAA